MDSDHGLGQHSTVKLRADLPIREGRVVLARPDGSGVVEIPVATVTPPHSGFPGFALQDLRDMVANFERTRGIIVGVTDGPHLLLAERSGPQLGFVEALSLRGEHVWARIDCLPELFAKRKYFRGFSVETRRDEALPDAWKKYGFNGWVLVGGIFTNLPATDSTFRIAASVIAEAEPQEQNTTPRRAKGAVMDDTQVVSLATHEAKVGELRAEVIAGTDKSARLETHITSLQTEVATLRTAKDSAEAEATTSKNDLALARATTTRLEAQVKIQDKQLRDLTIERSELQTKLKERDQATDRERVTRTRDNATLEVSKGGLGLPPALFEFGEGVELLDGVLSTYASVEKFEEQVRLLGGVGPRVAVGSAPTKSGHDPASASDPSKSTTVAALQPEEQKVLDSLHKNLGLRTEFAHATNEAEARAIHERNQAQAAAK